jgi:hypothetical protein
VTPALDAMVVDMQVLARLSTARADTAATEPHGHDQPLAREAHVDDRRAGKAQAVA